MHIRPIPHQEPAEALQAAVLGAVPVPVAATAGRREDPSAATSGEASWAATYSRNSGTEIDSIPEGMASIPAAAMDPALVEGSAGRPADPAHQVAVHQVVPAGFPAHRGAAHQVVPE